MSDPELRERLGARSDLADLQPYRAPQLDAPVKLNTNESPYAPGDGFMKELADRIIGSSQLNRYPDRDFTAVREGLASHVGTLTDHIWAANGSNEILLQLLLAFGGPDRKVMTFEPTYAMHSHITKVTGTRHLRARRNPDLSMHLEASVEAVRTQRPDIVFLCSPNNPSGGVNSQEEIEAICEAAPGMVILDEAYAEFSGVSYAHLVDEHENLVVTRSFSKAWRLAGARVGYLVASPATIDELLKVRLPYHLSSLAQAVVITALNHAKDLLGTVETIRHERDRLYRELSTTRGITAFPTQANFILFRCESEPASEVWKGLLDRGILIRDFSDLPGCDGCLRVSVGTPEQDEKFLDALADLVIPR